MSKKASFAASSLGVVLMVSGQLLARPSLYGTFFGRVWAHMFWLGFALFAVPLLMQLVLYVARSPHTDVVKAERNQLVGMAFITLLVSGAALALGLYETSQYGSTLLTAEDGDARRGVFVLWALLTLLFTLGNLLLLGWRLAKSKLF